MKMKTPDEIKKGLMICSGEPKNEFVDNCDLGCPYNIDGQFLCGIASMMEDALAYIEQLEAQIESEKGAAVEAQEGVVSVESGDAISRNAVLEILRDEFLVSSRRKVVELPTLDVAPVLHARWEWLEEWSPSTTEHLAEYEDYGWRCGRCKTALEDMVGGYWDDSSKEPELNFCPNCGAKMDEG